MSALPAFAACGLFFCTFLPSMALADIVFLKSGKTVEGILRDDGGPAIEVKTDQLDFWIGRDQIERVQRESPAEFFVRKGDEKIKANDLVAARKSFLSALEAEPENPTARERLNAANALLSRKELTQQQMDHARSVQKMMDEAARLKDQALEEEALVLLNSVLEKDPHNIQALAMAAELTFTAYTKFKVPESLLVERVARLEARKPDHPKIKEIRAATAAFKEKRKMKQEEDRQNLYAEIMKAHKAKKYDYKLLSKIDRFIEMKPGPQLEIRMNEIRKAADDAGIGRLPLKATSAIGKSQ